MKNPEYFAPKTIKEALSVLKKNNGVKIIAGGTDLLPLMRSGSLTPGILLDLKQLDLNRITLQSDHICIGAYVTLTQITNSKIILDKIPLLATACNMIGGPPTRNLATIGGNLVNASPAADAATPLLALDALLVIVNDEKEREVPISKFFLGPGKTALSHQEILKEVHVPLQSIRQFSKFIKMGKRKAMAIAIISIATCLTIEVNGVVSKSRIALGSVAPVPIRAKSAEKVLEGQIINLDLIFEAARKVNHDISPINDLRASSAYRLKMGEVLTKRALVSVMDEFMKEKSNA